MSKNPYSYQHTFDITNVTTDPFALGTLSVGFISWIIFVVGCGAFVTSNLKNTDFVFPRFSWWSIAYEFALIVTLFIFYCFDMVDSYRSFLAASFGVAFVYTTNSANNLVYSSGSALAAASTGVILISMVNMIWLIYYGADSDSPINRWIDGFSLNRRRLNNAANLNRSKSTHLSALASNPGGGYDSIISHPISNSFSHRNSLADNPFNNANPNTNPNPAKYSDYDDQTHANTQMNSLSRSNSHYSQKFSTQTDSNADLTGYNDREQSDGGFSAGISTSNGPGSNIDSNSFSSHNFNNGSTGFDQEQDIYPYRARALYAYEANTEDVNEISFEKGEILMISDIQGRWWQAKRENGEIGICPSNYVELIN